MSIFNEPPTEQSIYEKSARLESGGATGDAQNAAFVTDNGEDDAQNDYIQVRNYKIQYFFNLCHFF